MKRPSFQFYPADWRQNANLRRCSPAARGTWMDVMCLLHDSEEYGLLRWPLKDIASAASASMPNLRELVAKGVLKGNDKAVTLPFIYTPRSGRKEGEPVTLVSTQDGPVWYSSRMVKDEYIRTVRGENTRFGANKDDADDALKRAPKLAPKPPFGDGSSSSSSSSTSVNTPKAPKGAVEVPDWIPEKPWADFVAMRRAKGPKTPFTVAAAKGVVEKLSTFRAAGHDVAVILQESTINGWSSVFEPKGRQQQAGCRDDWTSAAT